MSGRSSNFAICALLILSSLSLSGEALSLPGYGIRLEHTICKDQIGDDAIRCIYPSFIWIHEEYVGYTPHYWRDDQSGYTWCVSGEESCRVRVTSHHIATTYLYISGLSVANQSVPCDNATYEANYLIIYYSCIPGDQLDRIDMCSSSSNISAASYLATPNFPSGVAPSDHDCTCQIESFQNPGAQFAVDLFLLYAGLPEPTVCGEQTWAEAEGGQEITHKCSPGWTQLRSMSLIVSRITLRFVKNASNSYEGGQETKAWYGVDADTVPLSITCLGDAGFPEDAPGFIDILPITTSDDIITVQPPASTEPFDGEDGSSGPVDPDAGTQLATVTLVAIIAAVTCVCIAFMAAVAIVCIKKRRKPTELPSAQTERRYVASMHCEPHYDEVEYETMAKKDPHYLNVVSHLKDGGGLADKEYGVRPDILGVDGGYIGPAESHPRPPPLEVPEQGANPIYGNVPSA